jgi:hypothetical protein
VLARLSGDHGACTSDLMQPNEREFDTVGELKTETYWLERKVTKGKGEASNELTTRRLAPGSSGNRPRRPRGIS